MRKNQTNNQKEVKKNYFVVSAKCGHVGRNNYIVINFTVVAENGKEAAKKVRYFPRVKTHAKDAILNVERVSRETYMKQHDINNEDRYFYAKNKQQQRIECPEIYDRVQREDRFKVLVEDKKKKEKYRRTRNNDIIKKELRHSYGY